jgi:asparagine synthase (glutamine-hydrolysing)
MCGIAVSTCAEEVPAMLEVLQHRGRDGRGCVSIDGLTFGHNRLAIVDLSDAGAQPLVTPWGVTLFNGEIYNYRALAQGLDQPLAHANEIHVLAALLRETPRLDRLLDGSYAVVHYDRGRQRLHVYRDLFGIVPLYYQTTPHFAVASEKKALQQPREIPAGACWTFDRSGRLVQRQALDPYWLPQAACDLARVEQLLRAAVQKRIVHSDRPVSIALSGGLDSSLVAWLAVQYSDHLQAITIATDAQSQEAQNAVQLAARLNLPHRLVVITPDDVTAARAKIEWHLEDTPANPIKWRGALRNWFVAQHAPGVVILCGEGADEIGGGYESHLRTQGLRAAWKQLSTVRSMPAINLDRVNKCGMAWTKEYRTPFLDQALALYLLSCRAQPGKIIFKQLAERWELPHEILDKPKVTAEEDRLAVLC